LGILVLGIIATRGFGRNGGDLIPTTPIQIPETLPEEPIQEPTINPAITQLKNIIAQARKATIGKVPRGFVSPVEIRKGRVVQTARRRRGLFGKSVGGRPRRGQNVLGAFGAAGVRTFINPFTGARQLAGFGPRASGKTRAFFGTPTDPQQIFAAFFARKEKAENIIQIAEQQLRILETKSV